MFITAVCLIFVIAMMAEDQEFIEYHNFESWYFDHDNSMEKNTSCNTLI